MTKYQEIESTLLKIEGGMFQNICDAILSSTEKDFCVISRPGSQSETLKTIPGTPDTYFVLSNGDYVFVEYTTFDPKNRSKLFKKIKEDIAKCADEKKTGIGLECIDRLIYCTTAEFATEERKMLVEYGATLKLRLDIRGLHAIARQLVGPCVSVARDLLGISIDTHQILSPEVFAQEYEDSGLATPLCNTFLHREKELSELMDSVRSVGRITILCGPAGMGKSRLAMQAFSEIKVADEEFVMYCISNKNAYLYDDLRTYLAKDRPYLLLIDDANRQTGNLAMIVAMLQEKREHPIHLIITVRDYALKSVVSICDSRAVDIIKVERFTDQELRDILICKDFAVQGAALEKIIKIAGGNARLAIMAAKIYLETHDMKVLTDVASIYDRYFESAIGNEKLFSDRNMLKSFGLLCFFFSIDLEDKEFITELCEHFGLQETTFRDVMIEVEKLELAESNEDLSVIKIGDQVLGNYFFYRTFIRDGVLDLRVILKYYRNGYLGRLRDSLIPADTTFSFERIYPKVNPILSEFWPDIMVNEDEAKNFLDLFWKYRPDDLFAYVYTKIPGNRDLVEERYCMDEKAERFGFNRDVSLGLLDNFFSGEGERIDEAIELSLEYVRAYPVAYAQLIKTLRSEFSFSQADYPSNFARQAALWSQIIPGARSGDKLCVSCFFDISQDLMKSFFSRESNNESGIRPSKEIEHGMARFRAESWEFIKDRFTEYPQEIQRFLLKFIEYHSKHQKQLLHFDLAYLLGIFDTCLDLKRFEHCFIVRELLRGFRLARIANEKFNALKKKFNSQAYRYYTLLIWDRFRDRDMFDGKLLDFDEYPLRKEQEIRKHFNIRTITAFRKFYAQVQFISDFRKGDMGIFHNTINIILLKMMESDAELALKALAEIVNSGNVISLVPYKIFSKMVEVEGFADKIFDLFARCRFLSQPRWLQVYVYYIPEGKLKKSYLDAFLNQVEYSETHFSVHEEVLLRLKSIDAIIFKKVFQIVVSRKGGELMTLNDGIFKNHIEEVGDIDLVKKAYIIEERKQDHFDYQFVALSKIIEADQTFLIEFIRSIKVGYEGISASKYYELNMIWDLPNAEKHVCEVLDYCALELNSLSREDSAVIFFSGLSLADQERAKEVLRGYLLTNAMEIKKVDLVMTILRNQFHEAEEELILEWLIANPSYEDFRKIEWQYSTLTGGGSTVFSEIRGARMAKLLAILGKMGAKGYKYAQHRTYLLEQVSGYQKQSRWERRKNFMYGD